MDELEEEKRGLGKYIEDMKKSKVDRENEYLYIVDRVVTSNDTMFWLYHLRALE